LFPRCSYRNTGEKVTLNMKCGWAEALLVRGVARGGNTGIQGYRKSHNGQPLRVETDALGACFCAPQLHRFTAQVCFLLRRTGSGEKGDGNGRSSTSGFLTICLWKTANIVGGVGVPAAGAAIARLNCWPANEFVMALLLPKKKWLEDGPVSRAGSEAPPAVGPTALRAFPPLFLVCAFCA